MQALNSSKLLEDMAMRGVRYVDCYGVANALTRRSSATLLIEASLQQQKLYGRHINKRRLRYLYNEAEVGRLQLLSTVKWIHQWLVRSTRQQDNFDIVGVCLHMFTLDFLNQVANGLENDSIYHLAEKKIPSIHDYTMGFTFEQFIFDAFAYTPSTALFEVLREEEFAPVKNANGASYDTPDSAGLMLLCLHCCWVVATGGS